MAPEAPSSDHGNGKNGKTGEGEVENQDQKVEPPRPKGAPNRYKCCLIIHFLGGAQCVFKNFNSNPCPEPNILLVEQATALFGDQFDFMVCSQLFRACSSFGNISVVLQFKFDRIYRPLSLWLRKNSTFNHMHRASIFNTII